MYHNFIKVFTKKFCFISIWGLLQRIYDLTERIYLVGLYTFLALHQLETVQPKQQDIYIYKVVISVCLFVSPIITQVPLD